MKPYRVEDGNGGVSFPIGGEWESGRPIDAVVIGDIEAGVIPLVKWKLPSGDRIVSTLADYNSSMPFIHQREAAWRNHHNALKRGKMESEKTEWERECVESGRWPRPLKD